MKKLTALLPVFVLFISLYLTSCTSMERDKPAQAEPTVTSNKTNEGSVTWMSNSDSTGGSHPDTLLIRYTPKDCTYAPVALMLLREGTGGSHPETTFVGRVVLKPNRKISKNK